MSTCPTGYRPISERSRFVEAAKFDFEERAEIEQVVEWLTDFPDEAAAYIVFLEREASE